MSRRTCVRCGRGQSDVATICVACARDLKKTLQHIADLYPHLQEAIGKVTAMGAKSGNKPTKASEQPLPVDMHASQVADRARTVLVGWTRVLVEDNQLTPPADTVPALCGWLRAHMGALRMHVAADVAADEITRASGQISRAVDLPADRTVVPAGACPETLDDAPCPGTVKAHVPRDSNQIWYDCETCAAVWDSTQLDQLGKRIRRREAQIEQQKAWGRKTPPQPEPDPEPDLAGIALTAAQYDIPISTMHRWIRDGVLTKHGTRRPWQVDINEVAQLKATRRIVSR